MALRVEWKKSTRKDLRKLPSGIVDRVIAAVEGLASDPYPPGAEKLAGSECAYRIRVVDYRIIYEVPPHAEFIEIQRGRHRKDVYRK